MILIIQCLKSSLIHIQGVSKVGLVIWAHLMGVNGLKSKSGRKETPIKIQFEDCKKGHELV